MWIDATFVLDANTSQMTETAPPTSIVPEMCMLTSENFPRAKIK